MLICKIPFCNSLTHLLSPPLFASISVPLSVSLCLRCPSVRPSVPLPLPIPPRPTSPPFLHSSLLSLSLHPCLRLPLSQENRAISPPFQVSLNLNPCRFSNRNCARVRACVKVCVFACIDMFVCVRARVCVCACVRARACVSGARRRRR